jgi:predicted Zn-dependent peptidase
MPSSKRGQASSTPSSPIADALAGDFFHLGRLRALTELSQAIDAVTVEQVKQYVHSFPAENLTVLTIGPKKLEMHQV